MLPCPSSMRINILLNQLLYWPLTLEFHPTWAHGNDLYPYKNRQRSVWYIRTRWNLEKHIQCRLGTKYCEVAGQRARWERDECWKWIHQSSCWERTGCMMVSLVCILLVSFLFILRDVQLLPQRKADVHRSEMIWIWCFLEYAIKILSGSCQRFPILKSWRMFPLQNVLFTMCIVDCPMLFDVSLCASGNRLEIINM